MFRRGRKLKPNKMLIKTENVKGREVKNQRLFSHWQRLVSLQRSASLRAGIDKYTENKELFTGYRTFGQLIDQQHTAEKYVCGCKAFHRFTHTTRLGQNSVLSLGILFKLLLNFHLIRLFGPFINNSPQKNCSKSLQETC